MSVFVDTSAFYALLVENDDDHSMALSMWARLLNGTPLVTSSYVLLETTALLQSRSGLEAVRVFHHDVRPAVHVTWVEETLHSEAMGTLLAAARRKLSLVDCTSFAVMRKLSIDNAFAFDEHFLEHGFTCLPGDPGDKARS